MRILTLAALLLITLVVAPVLARAEDPPAAPPAAKKGDEKKPDDEKKPGDEKGDDVRPTTPAAAPALASPTTAYRDLRMEVGKQPYPKRAEFLKASAQDSLQKWMEAGTLALGDELYSLAMLQQAAEQWESAAKSYAFVVASKDVTPSIALAAAKTEAELYADSKARDAIGAEAVGRALTRLLAHAATMSDEGQQRTRGSIETTVANVFESLERKQEAHDLRVSIAKRDPMLVGSVQRALVWGLLGKSHAMDGYANVRAEAEPVMAMLKQQQAKAVVLTQAKLDEAVAALKASAPDALDEQGNLKNKDGRTHTPLERAVNGAQLAGRSAKSLQTRLEGADKPFTMLGEPVPAWTLEHAFGETRALEDLKGKVVVLDFWATWCPWCIRSFPAIRDLLDELGAQGLVFVGVTASSSSVYAARYDLDDDLKDKAVPGERVQPAARLARGSQAPDGVTTFAPHAYKTKEIEVIGDFIKNHQMTWPVVMIDEDEPAPKYALGGWPHAIVLDRAGRVRYFKSGALLLDRKEAFLKFKKVLEDLLAEPAPKAD